VSGDSVVLESAEEVIIEQTPSYDILNGLRYLISQVDNLSLHPIIFDSRLDQALAEIHQNRVREDSVEACLKLLETRIDTFVRAKTKD
jgi:hypothetical protein